MTLKGTVCDVREGEVDVVLHDQDGRPKMSIRGVKIDGSRRYYLNDLIPIHLSPIESVK